MKSFFFLFFLNIFAITAAGKEKGYFVTNNNDTIKANFDITITSNDITGFSIECSYDTLGNLHKHELLKLTPNNAKTVVITHGDKIYKLVSKYYDEPVPYYFKPQKIFVEVYEESGSLFFGKINIGKYGRFVLQKGNDSLFVVFRSSVFNIYKEDKEDFRKYFSDCPAVAENIKYILDPHTLGVPDSIAALVKKYNQYCGYKMK